LPRGAFLASSAHEAKIIRGQKGNEFSIFKAKTEKSKKKQFMERKIIKKKEFYKNLFLTTKNTKKMI